MKNGLRCSHPFPSCPTSLPKVYHALSVYLITLITLVCLFVLSVCNGFSIHNPVNRVLEYIICFPSRSRMASSIRIALSYFINCLLLSLSVLLPCTCLFRILHLSPIPSRTRSDRRWTHHKADLDMQVCPLLLLLSLIIQYVLPVERLFNWYPFKKELRNWKRKFPLSKATNNN